MISCETIDVQKKNSFFFGGGGFDHGVQKVSRKFITSYFINLLKNKTRSSQAGALLKTQKAQRRTKMQKVCFYENSDKPRSREKHLQA